MERPRTAKLQLIASTLACVFFLALIASWQWTPLGDWIGIDRLQTTVNRFGNSPGASIWIIGGFALASAAAVPVTVLAIVINLVFGPILGIAYSWLGSVGGAILSYGIGHWLGRGLIQRYAGTSINRLSQRLANHGVLTMFGVRVVPVAPFVVMNLVAGASHISFRDYLLGTTLGMGPGLVAISILVDRTGAIFQKPEPKTVLILVLVVGALGLSAFAVQRWVRKRIV